MASRKTFIPKRGLPLETGFTLAEVLVVIGVILIFVSVSLFIDLNSYRGGAFRAERAMLITLLQSARADALNNIDQTPHGIAIYPADHPQSYVLFEGPSYGDAGHDPSLDIVTDSQYPTSFAAGSPTEVVFSQLSGNANWSGDIVMNDPQRGLPLSISVNSEGRISW